LYTRWIVRSGAREKVYGSAIKPYLKSAGVVSTMSSCVMPRHSWSLRNVKVAPRPARKAAATSGGSVETTASLQ